MPKQKETQVVEVAIMERGSFSCNIVGTSPMLCNAMSAKVRMELLAPKGRKTTAEKQATIKHDPIAEFRRSAYRTKDENAPTYIYHPAAAWKKAIANTAVDIAGVARAQIERLCWIEGRDIPLFGIPQLHMGVVRNSDMNRTPDIRTRVCLPEWASQISVTFMKPNLTEKSLITLLANAGMINGMGDWRQQKGGPFGHFKIVPEDDPTFRRIVETGGREAQLEALENPTAFDLESEELLEAYFAEMTARGREAQVTKAEPSTNGRKQRASKELAGV